MVEPVVPASGQRSLSRNDQNSSGAGSVGARAAKNCSGGCQASKVTSRTPSQPNEFVLLGSGIISRQPRAETLSSRDAGMLTTERFNRRRGLIDSRQKFFSASSGPRACPPRRPRSDNPAARWFYLASSRYRLSNSSRLAANDAITWRRGRSLCLRSM